MPSTKKCLVWDLDNTLWDGVCLEGEVHVQDVARQAVEELDRRGILHSIASRGEEDIAMNVLREHRLDGFFLVPRINWLPKPTNIIAIAHDLNLSIDSIAFIDDDPFEREQVAYMLPEVATIEARAVGELPFLPSFSPTEQTGEGRQRRLYYQAEGRRQHTQSQYPSREAFLKACEMRLRVRRMAESDIPRVLELVSRTHQLNTTGLILSREEILNTLNGPLRGDVSGTSWRNRRAEPAATQDPRSTGRVICVAELEDRFGPYGTIGVAIADTDASSWVLEYLAVSCRVLGRGIERAFLSALLREAGQLGFEYANALLRDTGRNRAMRTLYQIIGLREQGRRGQEGTRLFRIRLSDGSNGPSWVEVL